MTERKPQGVSFETWIDKQIREAEERGAFDNLPGAGKPLASLQEPDDELWWVNQLMKRENLVHLPPSLQLRKDAEATIAAVPSQRSEADVRRAVEALNNRILVATRTPISGPPHRLVPLELEAQLVRWRESPQRQQQSAAPAPAAPRRWWRRS